MSALALLVASVSLATCPVTHVHYTPYRGVPQGLGPVPWIATSNGAFYGHLFFVEGTPWRRTHPVGAHIFTTRVHRAIDPKVLWLSRRGARQGRVLVRGRQLGGSGTFEWRAVSASAYQFPSYVPVPSAGCWRVTVSSGGLSGSVVFAAVDTF
ncbi:MAG TPA: hypothetical protein VHC67_07645 [Gaiellaceae bacterium]|nr:hypothetical protein [Gaiellaceae bacterium]